MNEYQNRIEYSFVRDEREAKSKSMTNLGNIMISDELDASRTNLKNNIDNNEKEEYDQLEQWFDDNCNKGKKEEEERLRREEEERIKREEEEAAKNTKGKKK